MKRRDFLISTSAGSAALALQPGLALAQSSGDAALNRLLDRVFYDNLLISPEAATGLGLDKGLRGSLKSRLDDRSGAGRQANLDFTRQSRASLAAIAPDGLSQAGKRNREIALHLFDEQLQSASLGLESAQSPYPITQQNGAYFDIPDFLDSQHTVENAADAEAYLSRLNAFAYALDDESAYIREQGAKGIIAPAWSLDLVLGQMRSQRSPAPEDSPMVQSLAGRTAKFGIAGDWGARAASILRDKVYPALDRQLALIGQQRRVTRAGDGAWRLPKGDEIYAMALRHATTTDLSPQDVHKIGLEQVADLTAQLDAILKSAGYTTGPVGQRLKALNTSAEQVYPNTDAGRSEMIAGLNAGNAAMQARLSRAFGRVPQEVLEIRRVPPEIQDGAPNGYYYPAALDGSRPAIYWINLKQTGDWPKYQLPSLTYHEGVPGHHLQGGYARLAGDLPLLLQNYFISAYGEGWALYAEQLADELGGYTGIEKAGYLQSFLFRATRLVVDTGLNHMRWSRARATRFMVDTVGFTQARSQREIDRYCASIGQACSYKIGHLAWVKAREKAQRTLGDKFNLAWFHDVLGEGSMPLSMLERRVDERIRERLAAG